MSGRIVVKYLLFTINLLCVITALSIMYKGYLFKLQYAGLIKLIPELVIIPYIVIGFGGFVFLISFFGCAGAITETTCLLITYAVFLVSLATIKFCITGYLLINLGIIQKEILDFSNKAFDNSDSLNILELVFECCGKDGPNSYGWSSLSSSCCGRVFGSCLQEEAYQIGCTPSIHNIYVKLGTYIGTTTGSIIFVELIAVAGAIFMIKTKSLKTKMEYQESYEMKPMKNIKKVSV